MRYEAYCNGHLTAIVRKDTRNRWIIEWPSRGYSKERIADLAAAKEWVSSLLHGKLVTWLEIKK